MKTLKLGLMIASLVGAMNYARAADDRASSQLNNESPAACMQADHEGASLMPDFNIQNRYSYCNYICHPQSSGGTGDYERCMDDCLNY